MLSVHHVGITVSDLERSVGFYHDLIGLRFVVPPTPWFEGNDLARGLGVRPPVALRVALFEVGDGQNVVRDPPVPDPALVEDPRPAAE